MKFDRSFILALVAAVSVQATKEHVTPIEKVVTLLTDLHEKVIKDGKTENVAFGKFTAWCKESTLTLGHSIEDGKRSTQGYQAIVEKSNSVVEVETARISELGAAIASGNADLKAAEKIRAKELADFTANDKNLAETIDTLVRAQVILSREKGKVSQAKAASLVQSLSALVSSSAVSGTDARRLTALVQSLKAPGAGEDAEEAEEERKAFRNPVANAYESHSKGIIDVLADLQEKAEAERAQAQKEEVKSKHSHEMLVQSLKNRADADKKDMGVAKAARTSATEAKAGAEGDFAQANKALDTDTKALADTKAECEERKSSHEEMEASRVKEIAAIEEALTVIGEKSGAASMREYAADAAADAAAVSFLQVRGPSRVGNLVKELARAEGSDDLAELARKIKVVSAAQTGARGETDVFAKVKTMISGMIAKLQSESTADATHEAFCTAELKKTAESKADKQAEVDKLDARISKGSATSSKLKQDLVTLNKELADLSKLQAEMTAIRKQEKAAYDVQKKDYENGLEGVRIALRILRKFYAEKETSTDEVEAASSFLQAKPVGTGASGGIISMLEVVESDFSRSLAEINANENEAVEVFRKQSGENRVTVASKKQDVTYKEKEAAHLEKVSAEWVSDRASVMAELEAVLQYSATIDEQCKVKTDSYSERSARRAREIEGLKKALTVLRGEAEAEAQAEPAAFLQKLSLRGLRRRAH